MWNVDLPLGTFCFNFQPLKSTLQAPEKFVELDPDMAQTLLDQRDSGKQLLLITNSDYEYTNRCGAKEEGARHQGEFDAGAGNPPPSQHLSPDLADSPGSLFRSASPLLPPPFSG